MVFNCGCLLVFRIWLGPALLHTHTHTHQVWVKLHHSACPLAFAVINLAPPPIQVMNVPCADTDTLTPHPLPSSLIQLVLVSPLLSPVCVVFGFPDKSLEGVARVLASFN